MAHNYRAPTMLLQTVPLTLLLSLTTLPTFPDTLLRQNGGPFVKAVVEPPPRGPATAPNTDFPSRGSGYRSDSVIPLYVGDTRLPNAVR